MTAWFYTAPHLSLLFGIVRHS